MRDAVIVDASPGAFRLAFLERGAEFMACFDAGAHMRALDESTPNITRQLDGDLPRSYVSVNGHRMYNAADLRCALDELLAPCARGGATIRDISLLCTQGGVGVIVVAIQSAIAPCIVAELDHSSSKRRALRVDVRVAGNAVDVKIRKPLRAVCVDELTGSVDTVCGLCACLQFSPTEPHLPATLVLRDTGRDSSHPSSEIR